MSETRRYILTLRKVPRAERGKFRALSRVETYREIRPGDVGERVAYRVEMSGPEYEQARRDAEDPRSNLIAIEPDQRTFTTSAVPGRDTMVYHGADSLEGRGFDGRGVDVGIIETYGFGTEAGCILDTVFAGRVKAAKGFGTYNFGGPELAVEPCQSYGGGHGEMMVGIAVPAGARVVAAATESSLSTFAQALYWLVDEVGVDVINISQGYQDYSVAVADAARNAHAKGVLMFASAGNGGNDNSGPGELGVVYPAKYPEMLAISNFRPSVDRISSSSNYGPELWAATGGCEINVYENLTEIYLDDGGTSAAAAVATRIVASLLHNPKKWKQARPRDGARHPRQDRAQDGSRATLRGGWRAQRRCRPERAPGREARVPTAPGNGSAYGARLRACRGWDAQMGLEEEVALVRRWR